MVSPQLCHPRHAEKSLLTQYEGAPLCGLFSRQLCVLLWVIKLQWFHEGLKTSLALTAQNVQQTTCLKWENNKSEKLQRCGIIHYPSHTTVFNSDNVKNFGSVCNYHSWNSLTTKPILLWCECHLPLYLQRYFKHDRDEWLPLEWANLRAMKLQWYELVAQVLVFIPSLLATSPLHLYLLSLLIPPSPSALHSPLSFILLSP